MEKDKLSVLSILRESAELRREQTEKERVRVARIAARPENADALTEELFEYMQCVGYWNNPELYHAYMLLLQLRFRRQTIQEFFKELIMQGKEIAAKEDAAGLYDKPKEAAHAAP